MNSNTKKQPALGRGLGALLTNADTDITSFSGANLGTIALLPISAIEANPFNPRSNFDRDALEELAVSIATHGIIQPLTVRKLGRDNYQLISGERRFRAAQLAGLTEVPAYIRVANDQAMLEMALVENIQREDLNAIEVGLSYQRLIEECNLTQEQLGQKISKSRSDVTNHLRLLKLPAEIQAGVRDNQISMGHARALVNAGDTSAQLALFQEIIQGQLSVRAIEEKLKAGKSGVSSTPTSSTRTAAPLNAIQMVFKGELETKLNAVIEIQKRNDGQGKLVIPFKSDADFNRIIALLNGE